MPEVVRISSEATSDYKILQVYKPTVVADHTADFDSGKLTIPDGQTQVVVLECTGTAAWDDSDTTGVNFSASVDLNGDQFVFFEPLES